MADVVQDMHEGLLASAVRTARQVTGALMDADVSALAGRRGRHDPEPVARYGCVAGAHCSG